MSQEAMNVWLAVETHAVQGLMLLLIAAVGWASKTFLKMRDAFVVFNVEFENTKTKLDDLGKAMDGISQSFQDHVNIDHVSKADILDLKHEMWVMFGQIAGRKTRESTGEKE